jgi:uncharacterized protein YegL
MKNLDRTFRMGVYLIALFGISGFSGAKAVATQDVDAIQLAVNWLTSYSEGNLGGWLVVDSISDIPLDPHLSASIPSGQEIHAPSSGDVDDTSVVSLYGWSDGLGILALWEVTVQEGEVVFVHGEVLSVAGGSSSSSLTEGPFLPTPGKLIKHEAVPNNIVLQQVAGPQVEVSNHWVEIYDDPGRTQNTRISVEGFGPDEDVQISVLVDGANVPDASGDPLVIHTDNGGVGSIVFTPEQNARTGRALVLAISPAGIARLEITDPTSSEDCPNPDVIPNDDERGGLTLERVLEAEANAAGGSMLFRLHYTQQAIDVSPDVDPQQALQELVTAYETQVGSWGFDAFIGVNYDSDQVAHFYINDGTWMFHSDRGTNSWPDDYCVDPQGKNRRINLETDIRTALEGLGAAFGGTDHIIAHEHFHNIEFAYNDGFIQWGEEGNWYAEGMARFIETIMDPADSYVVDPLPSLFYWDANRDVPFLLGLVRRPDRPLSEFDYDYAFFWGFVYTHNNAFEALERILREIGTAGDDVDTDGPMAISTALASVGGLHDSMDDVYAGFLPAVYTKDFNWAGRDWGALLNDVREIRNEVFSGTTLIIDNDPETSVNTWGMDFIRLTSTTDEDMELVFSGALLGEFTVRVMVYEGQTIHVVEPPNNRLVVPTPNANDRIAVAITRTGGLIGNYWVLARSNPVYSDVVLDFDRSGSMVGAKIVAAREASKTFVDLLQPPSSWLFLDIDRDRVGLVSFSSSARIDLPLTSDFALAKQVIDGYQAGGATNMGAALSLSIGELTGRGRSGSIHTIVYLTDGQTNTGPTRQEILTDLVPQAVDNDIRVYTFGFGGDVDAGFLEDVATSANGRYFFAPTADELAEVYVEISHAIKGWRQVTAASGAIAESQTVTAATLTVPEGTGLIKIVLAWPGSDLDLILRDPGGVAVDPGNAGVIYSGVAALPEYFEIYDPMPGNWTVEVYGRQVSGSTSFFVAGFRPGPLMQVKPGRWEFEYPAVRQTDFTVSEVGGLASLEKVTLSATDLVQLAAPSTVEAMNNSAELEAIGALEESAAALQSDTPPTIPGTALSFTPNGFNIPASSSQTITASFDLPPGTPTGTYAGSVMVSSSGGTASIGVQVTITMRTIAIDIKPGSDTNPINPDSRGKVPVAILSEPDFSAPTQVDWDTLTFGQTGDEDSLDRRGATGEPNCGEEDVNNDSLVDLVCHFLTQKTGFQESDTAGILRGSSLEGVLFEGSDSVDIVP